MAATLVLTLALATGCVDGDPEEGRTTGSAPVPTDPGSTSRPAGPDPSPTFTAPAGIDLDDTTTVPAPAPTPAPVPTPTPAVISVTGNGIGDLPLGTPQVDVLALLVPRLGEPEVQPAECPGGSDAAARFPGGLSVYFGAGLLTGWVLTGDPDPGGVPVRTDGGITIGDAVADLRTAHDEGFQWVPDSSLGVEFYIGSGFPYLGGLASGQDPADTVRALWAGDSCAAR